MNLIGGLFTSIIGLGVLGLVVWFWVLVFTALVRANQALKLYVEKNKYVIHRTKKEPFDGSF